MNQKRSKKKNQSRQQITYTTEDYLAMMNDTSKIIAQENTSRLSSMGPAASESKTLTDSVEFWSWMNRNYEKSGHFASPENMSAYVSGAPGQQNWAKKVVQGKGYEWDWMSSQRRSFKNLFKTFNAGDVANRPGSDVTVHDLLTGKETEQQLKAYTSKNTPHLKNTPRDMTVVTNAEKVETVKNLGYEDVVSFGDNESVEAARDSRLNEMASGNATPYYNLKNVSLTVSKAGIIGFVICASAETMSSYKKWKSGKISGWEYLREIMKSGSNAGITSTFSAGIMIPITAAVTTSGISSLVTMPISFVVSSTVDKIIAPAFARGDYKRIVNEASYYKSLADFCASLSQVMEDTSQQYISYVRQLISQQQRFNTLAGNVISQQALDDFQYYASLPKDEVEVVVSGMTSLLSDIDGKFDSLKDQNWFQRMLRTVTGKNKATKEDIHRNYERLGVYVSKAVEILYERQCLDEKVLVILGEQIFSLCKCNVSLNARLEELESWRRSIDRRIVYTRVDQSCYETTSVKKIVDDDAMNKYHEAEKLFLAGKLIDAFPSFKEAADKGVGRADYYLGEYFFNGYGHIKENAEDALEYWRKGMEVGDPLSTYEYGLLRYVDDDYQYRKWLKKHIKPIMDLAKSGDNAALYVFGCSLVSDHDKDDDLSSILDSLADSLKYFKESAKHGYWPAAFKFYMATEDIRKTGTELPTYSNLFVNVEWNQSHLMYGLFEVIYGAGDYDACARHFQQALWLRDDETEAAGFLAFLLNTGLIKDSLANGYSKDNEKMYFEAGLKSENEIVLFYVGLLFYLGLGSKGLKDSTGDGIGQNYEKAYCYLSRCYSVFKKKMNQKKPVVVYIGSMSAGYLGSLYLSGEGIKADENKAFECFQFGYEMKDPMSTNLLALCYKEGIGVKKDGDKAEKIMEKFKEVSLPGMKPVAL